MIFIKYSAPDEKIHGITFDSNIPIGFTYDESTPNSKSSKEEKISVIILYLPEKSLPIKTDKIIEIDFMGKNEGNNALYNTFHKLKSLTIDYDVNPEDYIDKY